jgi:succinate dehydrogenase / fumarate reductase membrane anchor subunit
MSGRAINWYLQRITGAALLLLLIMHFWVEHFTAEVRTPTGLTFEVIQRRFFQNPWFVAIDITFLFIALYHGLNGIRNICLDYTWGTRFRTPITLALTILGLTVAWWGVDAFIGNPHLRKSTNERLTNDESTTHRFPHSSFVIRHSPFPPPVPSPQSATTFHVAS